MNAETAGSGGAPSTPTIIEASSTSSPPPSTSQSISFDKEETFNDCENDIKQSPAYSTGNDSSIPYVGDIDEHATAERNMVDSWIFPTAALTGESSIIMSPDEKSNDSGIYSKHIMPENIYGPAVVNEPDDGSSFLEKDKPSKSLGDDCQELTQSSPQNEINFIPHFQEEERQHGSPASSRDSIPKDGGFQGQQKSNLENIAQSSFEDISFVPPQFDESFSSFHEERKEFDTVSTSSGPLSPPVDGSFEVDPSKRIHNTDSRDRDIDFTPAGSEIQATPPIKSGTFAEKRMIDESMDNSLHDINVIPHITGKEMETSSPPERGSFIGAHQDSHASSMDSKAQLTGVDDNLSVDAHILPNAGKREINFSPGGSEMETAPPPLTGSFSSAGTIPSAPNEARGDGVTLKEETINGEPTVDGEDEEIDPMLKDQNLWQAKKMRKTIREKQSLTVEDREEDERLVLCDGVDDEESELHAVDSNEEAEDLSRSIIKIGSMLGSSQTVESELQLQTATEKDDDDLLTELLGDGETESKKAHIERKVSIAESTASGKTIRTGNITDSKESKTSKIVDDLDIHELSDSIAKMEALLDEALDAPLEIEDEERNNGVESAKEDYVPDDDMAALEAILDEAVADVPESFVSTSSTSKPDSKKPYKSGLDESKEITDATEHLDEMLENILDAETEIHFEPTEDEASAVSLEKPPLHISPKGITAKHLNGSLKPSQTIESRQKDADDNRSSENGSVSNAEGKKSRFSNLTHTAKSKVKKAFGHSNQRTKRTDNVGSDVSSTRTKFPQVSSQKHTFVFNSYHTKPPVPRFRRSKQDSVRKPVEVPPRKPAVPRFTNASFMESTASSRRKDTDHNNIRLSKKPPVPRFRSKDTEQGKKKKSVISRLTSWTKKSKSNQTPTIAPSRLFHSNPTQMNETPVDLAIDQSLVEDPENGQELNYKPIITRTPSLRKKSDFFALSPLALNSNVSLSSYCAVNFFQSPRRRGEKGCQQKFNPTLHKYRGPCELCVFFLSQEERQDLDVHGRHVRVMFTTGGCCVDCKVFPRSFDDQPARLCRACYYNSHRKVNERFVSKWSRRVHRPQSTTS